MPKIKGIFSRRLLKRLFNQHGFTRCSPESLDALEEALLNHVDCLIQEARNAISVGRRAKGTNLIHFGINLWESRGERVTVLRWDDPKLIKRQPII